MSARGWPQTVFLTAYIAKNNINTDSASGTTPKIPDAVIDDLISFAENSEEFAELIASNRCEAEAVMEELLSGEDQEEGSLVCN